jgi:acyl carrier protein
MNRAEILAGLQGVFREFFGDGAVALDEGMTGADVEGWDSVSHIQLVFEIEEAFGVQFAADDIPQLSSVSAIIDRIEELSG